MLKYFMEGPIQHFADNLNVFIQLDGYEKSLNRYS